MSRPSARRTGAVLALCLLLPLSAVGALDDDARGAAFEVDRRGGIPEVARTPRGQHALSRGAAWSGFLDRHPGWVARWNESRGVPDRAMGPVIGLPEAPRDPRGAGRIAGAFLRREAAPWLGEADLAPVRAARDDNGWWVQFIQEYEGLRVVGARAHVRMDPGGRVSVFGADTHPGVAVDPRPAVAEAAAMRAATEGLAGSGDMELRGSELVVLPVGRDGGHDYRLAWEIEFATAEPRGAWRAHVDAHRGELLWRTSLVRHADVTGTASGTIELLQPGGQIQRSFRDLGLRLLDGAAVLDSTATSPSGGFSLAADAPGDYTLQARLAGPYGVVLNQGQGGAVPQVDLPVSVDDGVVQSVVLNDGNSRVQDRDAFYWTMESREYMLSIEPEFDLLDYPMPIRTDIPNQECNAFWDGLGINFFPQSGNCANTARVSSVVIHEYGHGVTDFQYRPFAPSGAMHEGFSDYAAATLLNDPVVGRGFFNNNNSFIRTIDNDLVYPDDLTGEVHADGLIIAAALWDLRGELGREATDRLWHFARYGFSENFHDYFLDLLVTDDDDANVYNGTPNFDAIVRSFRSHGIGDYSIRVAHDPEPDTEDTAKEIELAAAFYSVFAIEDSSVEVHVSVNGAPAETFAMTPAGGIREYAHVLGDFAGGTEVEYWFTAVDTAGTAVTSPPTAPATPFRFRVGADTEPPLIDHEALPAQPVDTSALRILASVSDNLDVPVATVEAIYSVNGGEPAAVPFTPLGDRRYEALLPRDGIAVGDALTYSIRAVDGAGAPNEQVHPAAGEHGFAVVRGVGRDFEAHDGGFTGAGDWEWGASGLRPAFSGERLWATRLEDAYSNQTVSDLEMGPFDLGGWTRAGLFFRHHLDVEPFWDGGHVEVSADGGDTWTQVHPDGAYPYSFVFASQRPGYSGETADWTPAAIDLTEYLGESDVRIRFRFATDTGLARFGWFLDDVQVAERQVLSRALGPDALSGRDGFVPLEWSPPAGIDPGDAGSSFLGYHVYRNEPGGPSTRLTGAPVAGTSYTDGTAVNGTAYEYRITAAYEDGESPPTLPVEAQAYRTELFLSPIDVDATAEPGETVDVMVEVSNLGTGPLAGNLWKGAPSRAADDVRILYDLQGRLGAPAAGPPAAVPPSGEWEPLATDPSDQALAGIPDVAAVEAQTDGENLYLRITGHEAWGQVPGGFTVAVSLDTDFDVTTGTTTGDFAIVAGAIPAQQANTPVILVDPEFNVVAIPHHVVFQSGTDVMEFGITLDSIGRPDRLYATVAVLHPTSTNLILDRVPDAVDQANWLSLPQPALVAFPDAPAAVPVRLAAGSLPQGEYTANLFLDTNDPDAPTVTLPVTFTVDDGTPVSLVSFTGESRDLGVELRWETSDERDHAGFAVFRTGPTGAEERAHEGLLTSDTGLYRFEDRGVRDGVAYTYRIADVDRAGGITYHGPVTVTYSGAVGLAAPVLRQNLPNPFRAGTRIRFGLDAERPVTLEIYSVRGRRVRTLAGGEVFPRGFHEVPWDGTDDRGRPVAAGVYAYRMVSDGTVQQRKLVVLR